MLKDQEIINISEVFSTTPDDIMAVFGDIFSLDQPITDAQYQQVLSRCEANNWTTWKSTFETWKQAGLI